MYVAMNEKESERQKELEASQIELERKQRVGDCLFADDGGPRRRGIKSYMKTSGTSSRRRG